MQLNGLKLMLLLFVIGIIPGVHTAFTQTVYVEKNITPVIKKRKVGDPLANLRVNMEVLTLFGERADISPDNKKVACMAKTFGDAMVVDVKSKQITCLTCNIPAAAFVRVMHLCNGDYILIGPEHFENTATGKKNNDLWFLSKAAGATPVKIGQRVSEGIAISKMSMKIAFTEIGSGEGNSFSKLVVADLDLSSGTPKLINKKILVESMDKGCTVEAQDFYNKDTKLTFFCYVPNGTFDVKGVDLSTKKITKLHQRTKFF